MLLPGAHVRAQEAGQNSAHDEFIRKEAAVIYETNLKRRAEGLAPLRWNAELANAARWFAYHAVEDHPNGHCGHSDLVYGDLSGRITAAGYDHANAWGENVVCGYVDPKDAVEAWMQSPGHHDNMMNPAFREIGMGYYQRESDARGYVVQDLAYDKSYAPVIINNEALTTDTPSVTLYIYNLEGTDGFGGLAPAKEMMIANEPTFAGAQWESFSTEKSWTLEAGAGWRTVYVKTRDGLGRSTLVHDTIYLGAEEVADNLTMEQVATRSVTFFNYNDIVNQRADAANWSKVQFSSEWMADDSEPSFQLLQGNGQWVSDDAAVGHQSFRLAADQPLSRAWMWSGNFLPAGTAYAYFRLKAANNQSDATAIKVRVDIDEQSYGPLEIKASDFTSPNQYQEFVLPFQVSAETGLIVIYFERIGDTDVNFDVATFYSDNLALDGALKWAHSGKYRSRMVWGRLTNDTNSFTSGFGMTNDPLTSVEPLVQLPRSGASEPADSIIVSDNNIEFRVHQNGEASADTTARITCTNCEGGWSVSSNANWLTAEQHDNEITVHVDAAGMQPGAYDGVLTVNADAASALSSTTVNVTMTVEAAEVGGNNSSDAKTAFLPVIRR
ncbi:MAG: CAP domain-containing protein [Caldilineaceae bacterium]